MQSETWNAKTGTLRTLRYRALTIGVAVSMLAGCTLSTPANVVGLTETVGRSVPGVKGKTLADQDRIDAHVARACSAGVYNKTECRRHTTASADRRKELRADEAGA